MADEDKLVKAGVEAALKPFADLLEKLAGPAVEEFGLAIQDRVRVFRLKRQIRLFQQTKKMLEEAGLEPSRVSFRLLGPIVDAASIEDNDELQDKWAALLANAASAPDTVSPAYLEVLKQLSPLDAMLLDSLDHFRVLGGRNTNVKEDDLLTQMSVRLDESGGRKARESLSLRLDESSSRENLTRLGLMNIHSVEKGETWYLLTAFGKNFCNACTQPRRK